MSDDVKLDCTPTGALNLPRWQYDLRAACACLEADRPLTMEYRKSISDLLGRLQSALSTRNEALEALEKCRLKFRYYEHCHRLKCTPEGDEKADRNREMADMCAAAISNASTKGSD